MIRIMRKRRTVLMVQMDTLLSVLAVFTNGNALAESGRLREIVYEFLHHPSDDIRDSALKSCGSFSGRVRRHLEPMLGINTQMGPNLTEALKQFNIASPEGLTAGAGREREGDMQTRTGETQGRQEVRASKKGWLVSRLAAVEVHEKEWHLVLDVVSPHSPASPCYLFP